MLPPVGNCILMILQFWRNLLSLLDGTAFLPNLEVVFTLQHCAHENVGCNHRALVDCVQLQFLATDFEDYCSPHCNRKPKDQEVLLFDDADLCVDPVFLESACELVGEGNPSLSEQASLRGEETLNSSLDGFGKFMSTSNVCLGHGDQAGLPSDVGGGGLDTVT
jgi:hypothetical protein